MMLFDAPPLSPGHFIARTAEELQHMVSHVSQAREVGIDFETSGNRYKDGAHVIGASLGYIADNGRPCAWYVPVAHTTPEAMADPVHARAAFRDALLKADGIVGHNLKFDLNFGRSDGFDIPENTPVHCTYIQAHMVYERRSLGLENLVANEPGCTLWDAHEAKERITAFTKDRAKMRKMPHDRDKYPKWSYLTRYGHSEVPVGLEAEYSCRDVAHTLLLDRAQRSRAMAAGTPAEDQCRFLYENEMLLVRALADMEWHGQDLDVDYIEAFAEELDIDLETRSIELNAMFRRNWSVREWSNDNRVRELLYSELKLPVVLMTEPRFGEPQPSIARGALLMISRMLPAWAPHLDALAEFGARVKVQSTYTRSLAWRVQADGKLHPDVRQTGTATGRLSMSPNLQNIPTRHKILSPKVRRAFTIYEGLCRVYADYSQVELRMLAWITGNPTLTTAYQSPSWEHMMIATGGRPTREWQDWWVEARKHEPAVDVHGLQAKRTFGVDESHGDWKNKRRAAKVIGFGVPYGMGPSGLQSNPELMLDKSDAEAYFEVYHRANPEINAAKARLFRKMKQRSGVPMFRDWCGRSVHGPGLRFSDDRVRSAEERSVFASLVQGSAAELTRISIVRLWQAAKRGEIPGVSTSTVHDEIQVDCRKEDKDEVAHATRRTMEDFHGLFGHTPIVCDIETSETTWADKKAWDH
jgi:DNA polymerase I-like protein with 3'-5' exonuclease and polymerase domains